MNKAFYNLLTPHLSPRKQELFQRIAQQRTRHLTFVLEDIYQAQNTSAIFRSLECCGVQDVHVVENKHHLNLQRRVAKGAYDWLTLHRYNTAQDNSRACLTQLREKGYSIFATSLNHAAVDHTQLDVSKPLAIVMGTELSGVSDTTKELCDGFVRIPTYGFTESLNVSVATSILIQYLSEKVRNSSAPWALSEDEQLQLKIEWAKKSIYWSQHLIDLFENGEIS